MDKDGWCYLEGVGSSSSLGEGLKYHVLGAAE